MTLILALLRPLWDFFFRRYAIRGNVVVGRNLHLGIGSKITGPRHLRIGNDVYVGKLCTIECDGEIGDHTCIANAVGIIGRHDHDISIVGVPMRHIPWIGDRDFHGKGVDSKVVIAGDVWVGYGAIILSGVTIGRGAVIGAGTIVTKDIRPYSIVAGNPARELGARFTPEQAALHEEILGVPSQVRTKWPQSIEIEPTSPVANSAGTSAGGRFVRNVALLANAILLSSFVLCATALAWSPPGNGVDVKEHGARGDGVADDTQVLQNLLDREGAGNTIVFPSGRYKISTLNVPSGAYLYAPRGATIVGNLIAPGQSTTIYGLTFDGGIVDISNSVATTIGASSFNGLKSSLVMHGASGALIINNDFNGNSEVASITGWGIDRSIISGNHFVDSGQCIDLHFKNDPTRGRDIVIERNIFAGTRRMPVEVGPIDAYTLNLAVRDNWASDFKNRGPDVGDTMSTFVAYSLVPTRGVNTVISGNYAAAGADRRGTIGIELAGSGKVVGNRIQNFDYGAIVYSDGFDVENNVFLSTRLASVLNYADRDGVIAGNRPASRAASPRKPERKEWP